MIEATGPEKRKWFSIGEAAAYLDVGEPTLYRWMRDGKITFRKVGDSTRFWQEDLDSVMEVFHSEKDVSKATAICPLCRHDELVEGHVQATGRNYFVPKKAKFWTLKMGMLLTTAKMCARCGVVVWFADATKLGELRTERKEKRGRDEA
jgi:excisionase family DNA binding protein